MNIVYRMKAGSPTSLKICRYALCWASSRTDTMWKLLTPTPSSHRWGLKPATSIARCKRLHRSSELCAAWASPELSNTVNTRAQKLPGAMSTTTSAAVTPRARKAG